MANESTMNANDTGARLDLLAEQLEGLKNTLAMFSSSVVSALSGVPASELAGGTAKGSETVAKRRGRPLGSKNKPKPAAAPSEQGKEMHALQRAILAEVTSAKRVTQSELASKLGVERSSIQYHTGRLLESGRIVKRIVKPKGQPEQVVFYDTHAASFKGE